jgi:hypothetical protein
MNESSGRYVIGYILGNEPAANPYYPGLKDKTVSILATCERDAREHFDTHYPGTMVSCEFAPVVSL